MRYTTKKNSKSYKVINIENKAEFNTALLHELDSIYPNLLDPRNVSENEMEEVRASWVNLHQHMQTFLAENNFDWGVNDSLISIVNRIYFSPDGEIEYYLFGIQNENVAEEKKNAYKKILESFSAKKEINLERRRRFAQCGKIYYKNYSD